MDDKETPKQGKTNIKNKILVSFILVIVFFGVGINLVIENVMRSSLTDANIASEVIDKIMRTFMTVGTGFIIIDMIAAIIISIFLSRYLTAPIDKLRNAVEGMEKGSFLIKIDKELEESGDEIGKLALSFRKMSENLKGLYESVEVKIIERTKELEDAKKVLAGKFDDTEKMNRLMVGRELKMIELKEKIALLEKEKGEKIG